MPASEIHIRLAKETDLEAVNSIIHAAVMTWDLPARVKRLSLPGYSYNVTDFDHLVIVVAENQRHEIVGTAAWEPADARDTPPGARLPSCCTAFMSTPRIITRGLAVDFSEPLKRLPANAGLTACWSRPRRAPAVFSFHRAWTDCR